MDAKSLLRSLIDLARTLNNLHELDWFYKLGEEVKYGSNENVKLVRADVDHVVGGLSVLYLFAIFESYFDASDWEKYLPPEEEQVLRAYRHVRHSIAHGHHGKRVLPRNRRERQESGAFDIALRENKFQPRNIIKLDVSSNKMTIDPTIGIHLRLQMSDIVKRAIAKVAEEAGV